MSLLSEAARIETLAFPDPWSESDILHFCAAGPFILALQTASIGSGTPGVKDEGSPEIITTRSYDDLSGNRDRPDEAIRREDRRATSYLLARVQEADEMIELIRIGTDPAARRKGSAKRLLMWLCENVKGRILLEVSERNPAALELYRKTGFQIIHRRPDYYPDGASAWIMEKRAWT